MAQQDDIIIIKTIESVTTSILDYFFNIALVTEIEDDDLVDGQTFNVNDKEEYSSLASLAEKFKTTSKIYKIGSAVFNQKNNNGVNQSNVRRLVVLRKKSSDDSMEACLNRIKYLNSYFILVNASQSSDISSTNSWVSGYRKMLFAQSDEAGILSDSDTDIASVLKKANAGRCALYYHAVTTESLSGAMASIMASTPIGGKTASYKKPTDITVETLTSTQEGYLDAKNVNYYVPFIGGAGDYSTRYLTSSNGVSSNGKEVQEIIAVDRTVLSLQASLMDALEQDIPYDDRGGTILFGKVSSILATLKKEGILAEDSIDTETGEMIKSYTVNVLTRATTKKNYPEYFAQKMFIIEVEVQFAGSAKRVTLTLAY